MNPKKVLAYGFFALIVAVICSFEYIQGTPYKMATLYPLPDIPEEKNILLTQEGVDLGRHLFYDPILSKDSSISCATCHKQAFAFSDNTPFSKDVDGKVLLRNTMPLYNLVYNNHFFWDGKALSIEGQINHPIREEMGGDWAVILSRLKRSKLYRKKFSLAFGENKIDSTHVISAIAQFERTLISNNSKYDKVIRGETKFTPDEYQGFVMANDQSMADCFQCHPTDGSTLGTNGKFSNNGLDKVNGPLEYKDPGRAMITKNSNDYGLFKIPSLRNIALTAPYMHDGRFNTLEEVLDFYSEGVQNTVNVDSKMTRAHIGGVQLSATEKRQIIAFLKTLTDSTFIQNEIFSSPFNTK